MTSPAGPRVLLVSHDGYGLGHARRNVRLAAAVHRRAPGADVTVVTGISSRLGWLEDGLTTIERVPSVTKGASGHREGAGRPLAEVLAERSQRFAAVVEQVRPDVVVVDRHPFGVGGEWRRGLRLAKRAGAAVVLGLRDVLDDPATVRRELAGPDWDGAADLLDQVLVYGTPLLCDHQNEYGLDLPLTYCGVVVDTPRPSRSRRDLLLVCSGGGADGRAVGELGAHLTLTPGLRETVLVMGPAAAQGRPTDSQAHVRVVASVPDCGELYVRAAACLQMAGYNSTYEALAAGLRPILVPRVQPRREQVIRATRLAHLGLADVLDGDATVSDVEWMLRQPRRLAPGALRRAGIRTNGADVAVGHLLSLAGAVAVGVA
ncbi:glycosyltransferase family protein [Pedococcus aerophilus]|uniref:Glycosyltransferase family protein n=1 Tax=Pedococcus aerophilus TaxID=436356 RepID=A0ABN3UVR4_9MICO